MSIANSGPGYARNEGIALANGKYLIMIDSDDVLSTDNLSRRASYLEASATDLLIGSYETIVMDDGNPVERKKNLAPNLRLESNQAFLDHVYELMEQQFMYVIWNKVYKMAIIKQHNISFPPYRSCEDRLFNLQYFGHVDNCIVTSEVLYQYSFDGKNSLTNKFFMNKFATFEEFYLRAVELVPEDEAGFSSLFLKGTMSCFTPLHSSSCPLDKSEKRTYIKDVLNNDNLKKAARVSEASGLMKLIFKILFSIPSVSLHLLASRIIYQISIFDPRLIERLKKVF